MSTTKAKTQAALVKDALTMVKRQENQAAVLPPLPKIQREMLGNILIASNYLWDEDLLSLMD